MRALRFDSRTAGQIHRIRDASASLSPSMPPTGCFDGDEVMHSFDWRHPTQIRLCRHFEIRRKMKLFGALSCFVFAVAGVQAFHTSTTRRWGLSSCAVESSCRLNVAAPAKVPGSAQLDTPWEELGFEFRPTNSHIRFTYKDGEWGKPELVKDPFISLHIGATALHYGQACFEGLKAFCHEDGNVYVFRPEENAARMQRSCFRTMMPELPTEAFVEGIQKAVQDNIEYVPPYGTNGSLYIRPLLFGSGPRIGLQPADEYTFLIMVIPVGDYYKGGLSTPVNGLIISDFDRAAPRGVGAVKVAGNYAADLLPNMLGKKKGYPIGLYLDAKTQTLIEEFSTSNFVGINNKNKKYVTPKSPSVLPSVTNKSLMQIAKDEGFTVEERDINVEELADFDEVIAVGTAVVITPVGSITKVSEDGSETVYEFGDKGKLGETTKLLYQKIRALQNGEVEDRYNWNLKIVNE